MVWLYQWVREVMPQMVLRDEIAVVNLLQPRMHSSKRADVVQPGHVFLCEDARMDVIRPLGIIGLAVVTVLHHLQNSLFELQREFIESNDELNGIRSVDVPFFGDHFYI